MIKNYKVRMREIHKINQAYFIPFYQARIENRIREKQQESLKNGKEMDDNKVMSAVIGEIIKLKLLIGCLYMSVFPNPFVSVYAVREFLMLVDRVTAADGAPVLRKSYDSKDLQFQHLIPLLEQDGFIRTADVPEDAFQYRLTAKGETLLEIMRSFMPDIMTGNHNEIVEKTVSGELLSGLRKLLASMDESALRNKLEEQSDALEKWIESIK